MARSVEEVQAIIDKKQQQLHKLQLREATSGLNTPADVLIQIDDLNAELKALEDELSTAPSRQPSATPTSQTSDPGSTSYNATASGGSAIAQGPNSQAASGGSISIGGNVYGNVYIGDTNTTQLQYQLNQSFTQVYKTIQEQTSLSIQAKQDIADEVQDIQKEVQDKTDISEKEENFIRRRLNNIKTMAPEIIEVIATTFANVPAGLKTIADKIVKKAREVQQG